ncbi:electron transport complex protein RnfD [Treponema sp. R8-4-B8]
MEPVNLIVSPAPHINYKATTNRIMLDVIIALLPAFVFSVFIFGPRAALITGVCIISCVFFEWAFEKLLKRKNTINDLSAVVTGTLLAYNLPVTIPVWQAIFGSFIAIVLVKQLYGGLGKNFANPAITGRVVMFLAFPVTMTTWIAPFAWKTTSDIVTGATPLVLLLKGQTDGLNTLDLFLGFHGGSFGEVSEAALLLGGLYLLIRGVITWHAPVSFIAVVFALTALAGSNPVYQIFSGGLFLGAIFMATDYVTTPQTNLGRVIFGAGCGILTVLIRLFGSYPEGVSYSILIMNTLVPFINKITYKKALGGLKA